MVKTSALCLRGESAVLLQAPDYHPMSKSPLSRRQRVVAGIPRLQPGLAWMMADADRRRSDETLAIVPERTFGLRVRWWTTVAELRLDARRSLPQDEGDRGGEHQKEPGAEKVQERKRVPVRRRPASDCSGVHRSFSQARRLA